MCFKTWVRFILYFVSNILTLCSMVLLINGESFSPCSGWWCLFHAALSGTVEPLADVILLGGMAGRGRQSGQITANLDV